LADDPQWWKKERVVLYQEFGQRLFGNLNTFFKTLQSAGKNFVVIFVPEHGMALRGSSLQSPDIREIPLPAITTVPVGIKLIGDGVSPFPERQMTISKPTSYVALSHLLSSFLAAPRFGRDSMLTKEVIDRIPKTKFLSENEASLVVKKDNDVFYYGKGKMWIKLPESTLR
jgi:hypothetical protein